MNAIDYNLTTIDPKGGESGLGLRSPRAFPALLRQHRKEVTTPRGLVVSGDASIRSTLGEALLYCGVAPIFATTIEQATLQVARDDFRFAVCQDRLPDGRYDEVLHLQHAARSSFPLIVVSSTGDWPEFFEAVDLGAYDFLAYPLIPGELQRIIRNLLDEPSLRRPASSDLISAYPFPPTTTDPVQAKNRRL
jgi:DNA-binding NtrC family response regulator